MKITILLFENYLLQKRKCYNIVANIFTNINYDFNYYLILCHLRDRQQYSLNDLHYEIVKLSSSFFYFPEDESFRIGDNVCPYDEQEGIQIII